ncbi:MAG TPA: hypothetical protein VJ455_06610 [Ignavibacteria bacterium]|nr:hypothetical protein [Ignavibacteria bacterium]
MEISPIKISEPFENREIKFSGIWHDNSWRFKIYKITHKNNTPADEKTLEIAKSFANSCIAKYTDIAPVYGLGYIILHKGMDSNFIVVCFWAGENMLRTHVMISSIDKPYEYIDKTETGMTVCVWDAIIHNFERNAWVENILNKPEHPSPDEYINSIYLC